MNVVCWQDTLFLQLRSELLSFLYGRVDRNEAEDIVQEAYLRWQRLDTAAIENPRAFLFTLALNLVRDRARHLNHVCAHKEIASLYHAEASHAADPANRVEGQNQLDRVLHALLDLQETVRHAFLLHRFDGLSHHEIAQRLSISAKTVERHICRASEACLAILAEDQH